MTPSEILKQEFSSINERVLEVFRDKSLDKINIGFGEVVPPNREYKEERLEPCVKTHEVPEYTHFIFVTKKYNDEGCATFKLLRQIQKLPENIEKIYWRKEPKVDSESDFSNRGRRWIGYARASIYPPIESMVK